jgi:hypothetical protein
VLRCYNLLVRDSCSNDKKFQFREGNQSQLQNLQKVMLFTDVWYKREASSNSQRKGKAVPLQAWTGPEGSRRLRLPDF